MEATCSSDIEKKTHSAACCENPEQYLDRDLLVNFLFVSLKHH